MRTSLVIAVLLGVGALGHPHFKLTNPLGHNNHKRQDPISPSIATKTWYNAQGQATEVEIDVTEVKTVYQDGVLQPVPATTIIPAPAEVTIFVTPDTAKVNEVQVKQQNEFHAAPTQQYEEAAQAKQLQKTAPQHNQESPHQGQSQTSNVPVLPVQPGTPVSSILAAAPAPVVSTSAASPSPITDTSSSSGSSAGPMTIGGQNALNVANKWRAAQGLPAFQWSDEMHANSKNTSTFDGTDSGGLPIGEAGANRMAHNFYGRSNGQVIGEGSDIWSTTSATHGNLGAFDLAYLNWLCEVADGRLPCSDVLGYTHMDFHDPVTHEIITHHADILRNADYTHIGCHYMDATNPSVQVAPFLWKGMFTCDLIMGS